MKITIDTKEDSKDEIRKAIRMLSAVVGDERVYTNSPAKGHNSNIFDSGSSTVEPSTPEPASSGSVFGNMFGDNSQPSASQDSDSSEEEKKEDKKPEIIIEY